MISSKAVRRRLWLLPFFVVLLGGCPSRPPSADGGTPHVGAAVIFTQPANGASAVALQERLLIEFSKGMSPALVNVSVQPEVSLQPLQWSTLDTVAETAPVVEWAIDTTYTVRIAGKDAAGAEMTPHVFTFSTGAQTVIDCSAVVCDLNETCENGQCRCGAANACGAQESCAKPPTFNDYQCFPNCAVAGTTTQSCGNACQACDSVLSDRCSNGQCSCGNEGPCASGQRCVDGQCICDATSCSNETLKGCCSGNVCVTANQQSVTQCRLPVTGLCDDFTAPSPRATSCVNGEAKCGTQPGCNSNSVCVNGACLAACSNGNCPNGCCDQGLCYTFDGSSSQGRQTSAQRCGTGGTQCQASTGSADTCNAQGNLVCGNSPSACLSSLNYCSGGGCTCAPGKTECGYSQFNDCCSPGQWCNVCSAGGEGQCGATDRSGEGCDDGQNTGTFSGSQVN